MCTLNGMPGCSTPGTWPLVAGAFDSSARMSSTGTAYEGQTRRGSQTRTARMLSAIASEPRVARTRRSIGS